MDEAEFWLRLELRVSAEFRGFEDRHLRRHWCDGLIAEEYELTGAPPCVRGAAWCGASGQERWRFVLFVDPAARSRAEIDWSALLPDNRATGWLSVDPANKTFVMDPLSGYPD
ncbi:hypothetical protein DFJ67_0734 [Asanoa ferruginea]|uniref:Uncharacterized protein n=1 Tax=Asanoa ferruginea TaxID=53367 RepID=A0A3D9ZMB5_9ACTN|nr:hypothetical protein [Asanoa ferruginea]REF94790.1 hypothetical protein DFJ67_0734 [Asanoa ferruginea]GIF45632.1 hypothetical protein Afe04nite_01710 [Asanoa ferruginea]